MKRTLRMTAAAALAVVSAACNDGAGTATVRSPSASATVTTRPSPSPSASSHPATMQVTLWYGVNGPTDIYLAPERHTIPWTQAPARAALERLIKGKAQDPDHSQPIDATVPIRSVTIRGTVATVDWGRELLDEGHGTAGEAIAIDSVVWTLTEFSSIERVRWTIEGRSEGRVGGRNVEDLWGHTMLSKEGWARSSYVERHEPVTLWTPLEGARSEGSMRVSGETVGVSKLLAIVRDHNGEPVQNQELKIERNPSGHQPWRGTFDATITFKPPSSPKTWTVEVRATDDPESEKQFVEDRRIKTG